MSRNLFLSVAVCTALPVAACLDTSGGDPDQAAPSVSEPIEIAALPTWPANPNWQALVLGFQ